MTTLLLLSQLGLLAFANAINPMVKGEYRIEHPKIGDLSEIESAISPKSFYESFQYGSEAEFRKNWVSSDLTMEHVDETSSKAFPGTWKLQSPFLVPGFSDDLSLVLGSEQTRAAIAHRLKYDLSIKDNEKLVVQYEVKLQKMLECGGAYIKLLKTSATDLSQYDHSSDDYAVIFGPDFCQGYVDEIHLVLKRENPFSGKSEDKFLLNAPKSALNLPISRLYTLILDSSDQSYEIRLDGDVVSAGSLLSEGAFQPPFISPKEIDDPSAVKPADWDDRTVIPDPTASKPDDWDESEPQLIPDPASKKPDEWDESIPQYIPDKSRSQPEWWNDEEDGKWIAPMILNPSCGTKKGCGKWKPKMVENEKFRGPWKAPLIANPNYKGEWKAPTIPNPHYYEDLTPANIEGINVVSFDIWATASEISFDNLYIGKSVEEAELIGNKTFIPKSELEKKELGIDKPETDSEEQEDRSHKDSSSVSGQEQKEKPEEESSDTPLFGASDSGFEFINRIEKYIQSSHVMMKFTKWFLSIDDLYKGMVISLIATVVVAFTVLFVLKFMIWAQGIDINGSTPSTRARAERKQKREMEEQSKKAVGATSTGIKPGSDADLSKRTSKKQSGEDDSSKEESDN